MEKQKNNIDWYEIFLKNSIDLQLILEIESEIIDQIPNSQQIENKKEFS